MLEEPLVRVSAASGPAARASRRTFFLLAASAALSACAGPAAQAPPPLPPAPHPAAHGPAAARIRRRGVLRVAVDLSYPPMAFRRAGAPAGFDVDLAGLIAGALRVRLAVADTPIAVMRAGFPRNADLAMGALTAGIVPGRASDPEYVSGQAILSSARAPVGSQAALRGLRVAAAAETPGAALAREAGAAVALTDLPGGAFAAVASGRAQAAIAERSLALWYAATHPGLRVTGGFGPETAFVAIAPSNAPELADFVSSVLRELSRDGGLARLRGRWHL